MTEHPSLRVFQIAGPVHSLGPGSRLVLWTQGCDMACPGCMSRATWSPHEGSLIDATELGDELGFECARRGFGLTISGGEPLQQREGLLDFLVAFRAQAPSVSILLYSGLEPARILERDSWLKDYVSAVVAGPFVREQNGSDHWRGSENQRLIVWDRDAAPEFEHWIHSQSQTPPPEIRIDGTDIHIVGIPRKGALAQLQKDLGQVGWRFGSREWAASDE